MHKCVRCGTEFEGSFCPECGAKWEDEKICPNCGAQLKTETKFCPQCGYSFLNAEGKSEAVSEAAPAATAPQSAVNAPAAPVAATPAPATQAQNAGKANSATIKKLYGIMRILPAILIAALSVLNLLFFLADVGAVSSMGESMGFGSVYKVLGEGADEIKPVITAMFVVNILALAFSAVALYFVLSRNLRAKTINVANKAIRLTDIFAVCASVICLVLFIIACAACGKIGGLAGDLGSMMGMKSSASAGVILPLVFSLIMAIVIALCPIARALLAKKNPGWREEENAALQSGGRKDAKQEDITEADGELTAEQQLQTLKNVKAVTRRLKTLKFALFTLISLVFPLAILLIFVAPFIGLNAKYTDWKPEKLDDQRKSLKKFTVVYGIFCAIMVAFLIVFEVSLSPQLTLLMSLPHSFNWAYGLISAVVWIYASTFILAFLLCLVTYPPLRKLEKTFYGVEKPSVILLKAKHDVSAFYVTEEKVKRKEVVCRKPAPDLLRLLHMALFVVVALIVFLVHMMVGKDFIFNSTKYVEKINLGDDYYSISDTLGRADVSPEYSSKDGYYIYFSENMREINEKRENLGRELENVDITYNRMMEIYAELEKLENKAMTLDYKYIRVDVTSYNYDSEISSVLLVASVGDYYSGNSYNYSAPAQSKVELKYDTRRGTYNAKVWFKDGSYHNSYVSPTIIPNSYGTGYICTWRDSFFGTEVQTTYSSTNIR